MTDPAGEAARRAWESEGWPVDELVEERKDYWLAVAAAREALAPLRKLHRMVSKRNGWSGHYEDICIHCQDLWPCDTAKLVYPNEEL